MIAIINGPNLNLVGTRQPEIYGTQSLSAYLKALADEYAGDDITLEVFQSNSEGEIIDAIQQYGLREDVEGIVINPGAYAHYSYAIADAIRSVACPVVEVHISNIHARENFRSESVTAAACTGIISGFGLEGYMMAVDALLDD